MTTDSPSLRVVVADAVAVLALGLVAASSLRESYGGSGWVVATLGGIGLGLLVAWVSSRWRWGAWPTAAAAFAAYLLAGTTLALPAYDDPARVPTLTTLRGLLRGLVEAWRDSLTLPTPLGDGGNVLVVPFVISLAGGVACGVLLWRSGRPGLASVAVGSMFASYAAFGDRISEQAVGRGLVLVLGTVVWLKLREARHVRGGWGRRLALTIAVIAVASGAGVGMSAALDGDERRAVLREEVQPPFDPRDYPSPLSRFRAYKKDLRDRTLLQVEGLPEDARLRIATMDYFDGIVWNVTGGPEDAGATGSFAPADRVRDAADSVEVRVTVADYTGVWVPSVGTVDRVVSSRGSGSPVLLNRETSTMAQPGGVVEGTTYTIDAQVPVVPAPESLSTVAALPVTQRAPEVVPEKLVSRSAEWVATGGGATAGQVALSLVDGLREEGFYSDGLPASGVVSPSGHGAPRLAQLVASPQMVGDEEQYSSAMAVAAQRLGVPTRVVIGFIPGGKTALVGNDITAWVEVALEGHGWVPLDPSPDKDKTLQQRDDDPDPRPQPQVLQPPDQPEQAEDEEPDLPQGAGSAAEDPEAAGTDYLGYVVLAGKVVGGTALVLSPLWLVALLKSRRRRRRRLEPDPVARISGGWRELTDTARDLGVRLAPGATRHETGRLVVDRFPRSEVHTLAGVADAHVFSGSAPTADEVAAYWADVDTALKRMRREAPLASRVLHRFSLASLPWQEALRGAAARLTGGTSRAARRVAARIRRTTTRGR